MMYLGNQAVGLTLGKAIQWKNPFSIMYSCNYTFYQTELPETVIIDFEGNCPPYGFEYMFRYSTGWKHIIIKNLIMPDNGVSTYYMFESNDNCESITFENCRIRPSRTARMFTSGYNGVKRINGAIDLSVDSSYDPFYFARVLQHFELVPNSMKKRYSLQYTGTWDDATLISVGNALDATVTASVDIARFTSRTQALTGKIENDLFVADENGTLSLYDFITTVKGWTIS